MTPHRTQLDPLNSPFPIPWNWVLATQHETLSAPTTQYYRSQSLCSPDGVYAAYSRIQSQLQPQFTESRISSVLFVEQLQAGGLQTITAQSPLAETFQPYGEDTPPGAIAIAIPVAWSADSQRVLAREFESLFGTDLASDYALVWEREQGRSWTVAPTGIQYSHAVLLGWSQRYPAQVLFRVYPMDAEPMVVRVDREGYTSAAGDDLAQAHGNPVNHIWAGPQAHA